MRPAYRDAAAAAGLAGLVAVAYASALDAGFVFDSRTIVLEDPRLRAASAEHLRLVLTRDYWWPTFVGGLYRPLTTLTYLVNYAVLGNAARPPGYHVLNAVLHWANACLVYLLARRILVEQAAALWVAAVFAVHPIATEAVTYVVGRADLLASLFVLTGLLAHDRGRQARGWRRGAWLAALGLSSALGILSKESALVLLGLVVWYDLVVRGARTRVGDPAGWVAVLIPLVAVWGLRARLYAGLPPVLLAFADNPLLGAGFWTARATAIGVIARNVGLLLWPRHLSCDYSYDQIPLVTWRFDTAGDWTFVAGVLVLAAATVVVAGARRRPAAAFFVGFFLIALLPTANLLRLIGSIRGDRFLYLPSIGFAGCVVLAVRAASRRPAAAAVVLGGLVAAYAARTSARNLDWHDDVRLWSSAVVVAPASFKTHQGLGYAYLLAGRPDLAVPEAERALAILEARPLAPGDEPSGVPLELGIDYWTMAERSPSGDEQTAWYEKAATVLGRAAQLDREENEANRRREVMRGRRIEDVPDVGNWKIYYYQGRVALRLGRHAEALAAFAYLRRLRPGDPEPYRQLARTALAAGRPEEAAVTWLQVLALDGGDEEAKRSIPELYARIDPGGCAVTVQDGRPHLDLRCPRVHEDLCDAWAGFAEGFAAAREAARAEQFAQVGRANGCAARTPGRRPRSP